jgi:hypothetical protein
MHTCINRTEPITQSQSVHSSIPAKQQYCRMMIPMKEGNLSVGILQYEEQSIKQFCIFAVDKDQATKYLARWKKQITLGVTDGANRSSLPNNHREGNNRDETECTTEHRQEQVPQNNRVFEYWSNWLWFSILCSQQFWQEEHHQQIETNTSDWCTVGMVVYEIE